MNKVEITDSEKALETLLINSLILPEESADESVFKKNIGKEIFAVKIDNYSWLSKGHININNQITAEVILGTLKNITKTFDSKIVKGMKLGNKTGCRYILRAEGWVFYGEMKGPSETRSPIICTKEAMYNSHMGWCENHCNTCTAVVVNDIFEEFKQIGEVVELWINNSNSSANSTDVRKYILSNPKKLTKSFGKEAYSKVSQRARDIEDSLISYT